MISPPTFSKLMHTFGSGGSEAKIVFDPITFFTGAGGADKVAAVDFDQLADYASSAAGSRRDDEGFAGSRFADIEQ